MIYFLGKEILSKLNRRGKGTKSRLYVWAAFRLYSFAVAFVVIGIGISGRIVGSPVVVAEFFTLSKAVVSRVVVEKTIVIGALPIFKAFELNLARLLLFGFVDFLSSVRDVERVGIIDDEELKSPNDIGSVFDIARFFKALEGNGLCVIIAVERTDDDKSRISVALKFFELANGIVDAEFSGIFRGGDDLKII